MATVRMAPTWLLVLIFSGCSSEPTPAPKGAAPEVAQTSDEKPGVKIAGPPTKKVTLIRTPDGGIQPQAVVQKGVIHLIYFKGEPGHGDVYYVKTQDDGKTFTKPLRVNSHPGSVIAAGSVRGAHLAVTISGRAHVAWMGSMKAEPKARGNAAPMLYARLNDDGTAFEPQRNLIQEAVGLDGGGSIAADTNSVYVAWHAPTPDSKGEENRRVWLTVSADDGKTFTKETPISPDGAGACGCCGMRIFLAYPSQPLVLFRGAHDVGHRPMYLLARDRNQQKFESTKLHDWDTGTCPMSTMAFADMHNYALAAWETEGQVYFAHVEHVSGKPLEPVAAPGKPNRRRHPALAFDGRDVLFAWTEGTAWTKGGSVAWQIYDVKNVPHMNAKIADYGRADGVPVWGVISAVRLSNGGFGIIY
jgi:hypothetical protein